MIDTSFDYHAHILPGCDHGCDSLKTALWQVAAARDAGIGAVCATPHFYPHKESVESFLQRREAAFSELAAALAPDSPRIIPGAEVLICEGMERMPGLHRLCLSGTNELLLELPFYRIPTSIRRTLMLMLERDDVSIVIAHAERYPEEEVEMLMDEGVPLQVNVETLVGTKRKKSCLSWVGKGCVMYIGSDIHMRDPVYREWERAVKVIKKCGR